VSGIQLVSIFVDSGHVKVYVRCIVFHRFDNVKGHSILE